MTYEFNAGDSTSDIQNPYKFENILLIISALGLIIAGVFVMMASKEFILGHQDKLTAVSLGLAAIMCTTGVKMTIQSLSQIRLFFGRSFPLGLASELPSNHTGEGTGTAHLINMLKHRAVEFQVPKGPLSGVLYSLVRPLISSPPTIQTAAVQHFHSVTGMVILLCSMAVSYFMFNGTEYEGVVSWIYLPLTGLSLITPFVQHKRLSEHSGDSNAMFWELLGVIAFSIFAPVVLPRYIPAFNIAPMWIAPFLLLSTSLTASILFLISIFDQMDNVQKTDVSCEQVTLGMNCQPSQLWTEINREFQNNWTNNIPNRPYANMPPDVGGEARGSFFGYIVEETQPQVSITMACKSFAESLKLKHIRMLAALTVWGCLLSLAASIYGAHVVSQFVDYSNFEISRSVLVVISLTVSSLLSFRIAHLLWSRMYFKSRLIWIETQGTYQQSELSIGNQFTGQAKSSSTLTRVEDATLRVWAADIVTVAFGQENQRSVMALTPADGFAQGMAQRLVSFAANQSAIATPTNANDLNKAMTIGRLSKAISADMKSDHDLTTLLPAANGHTQLADDSQTGVIKFYNPAKHFGFIQGNDGADLYFNAKESHNHEDLVMGIPVSYNMGKSPKGPFARNVRIIDYAKY